MLYGLFVERWVLNGAVPVGMSITCPLPAHSPLRAANQKQTGPSDLDGQTLPMPENRLKLCHFCTFISFYWHLLEILEDSLFLPVVTPSGTRTNEGRDSILSTES